ncbi:hypothetical protein [Luteimonas sp. 100069]|uniref:hypothetical protein n=1 Tax=Luteimonas sp. 100069 TaxID=2006109 RepID=UPI00131584EF|nr:hypothetical protein [Luteimonas sp. 100069]
MQARGLGAALALVLGAAGSATANDGQTREVLSQDGSFTGEIVGTPAEGSKFAQLQLGMSMQDVQELMDSAPDRSHSTNRASAGSRSTWAMTPRACRRCSAAKAV